MENYVLVPFEGLYDVLDNLAYECTTLKEGYAVFENNDQIVTIERITPQETRMTVEFVRGYTASTGNA